MFGEMFWGDVVFSYLTNLFSEALRYYYIISSLPRLQSRALAVSVSYHTQACMRCLDSILFE